MRHSLALAAAAMAIAAIGCSKNDGKPPAPTPLTWKQATVTAGGRKHAVEVARFERPIAVKAMPAGSVRRDDPLHTWMAWQSLATGGKDDKDLQAYAAFYTDGGAFLARLKSPAAQFFEDNRKADEQPQAVGIVKTGQYQALVYSVKRSSHYRAAVMVSRDGRFYIDDTAKLTNPVLRELAAGGYKIVRETR